MKHTNKQILNRLQEIFFRKLQEKTGWGRNHIIRAYKDSMNEVLLEFLDKQTGEPDEEVKEPTKPYINTEEDNKAIEQFNLRPFPFKEPRPCFGLFHRQDFRFCISTYNDGKKTDKTVYRIYPEQFIIKNGYNWYSPEKVAHIDFSKLEFDTLADAAKVMNELEVKEEADQGN
jgi:hypothetical protein